ncbi:branched-chain amino acid transport system II carrier protein [Shewanella surugensis]|uniref:Branched-chain amino acid transport system carrier protein n=1 Tax=Shewanella surugensis TaxID=212020 RepID=A0ABT0LBZ7_9GAMM|nr:branched-chain amino acid transport system II carrier protein [Shewanella surugensis]MCL1125189.1 branched-chain amino acid transport system II carrier protein [Shewanella surugensis]
MSTHTLNRKDTLALGFMTFAFFLGAGNLIFPPLIGFMAGKNMMLAMFGFLLTAVGLPLIALIAVAKSNGKVLGLLPKGLATLLSFIIFIIIGPAFGVPRTALVAYDIGVSPFLKGALPNLNFLGLSVNLVHCFFSVVFFTVVLFFAFSPGKLIDTVGKVLTPILIMLLIGLAISVVVLPSSVIGSPQGDYILNPFSSGILQGYNTMDALGALVFGILLIDVLRQKGINKKRIQTRYLVIAALIAALGLAFVYISLFYLGATSKDFVSPPRDGVVILTRYVTEHFHDVGLILLSIVVTLACLTTAVGVLGACAEFFHEQLPRLSYTTYLIIFSIICIVVTNVGLPALIHISAPVLRVVYPMAIALIVSTFLTSRFAFPALSHLLIVCVALIFSSIDALTQVGINMHFLSFMPLQTEELTWLLPTILMIFFCLLLRKSR